MSEVLFVTLDLVKYIWCLFLHCYLLLCVSVCVCDSRWLCFCLTQNDMDDFSYQLVFGGSLESR